MFRHYLEKWNRLFYDCHTDPNTRNLSKEILIQINYTAVNYNRRQTKQISNLGCLIPRNKIYQ